MTSWTQSNFLGGQWGVEAQGRIDDPDYRKALAVCSNAFPQESGCITRRPGLRMCGPTLNGQFAVMATWDIIGAASYDIEISVNGSGDSVLRVWAGDQPLVDSVQQLASISAAEPAEITLTTPESSWADNDILVIAPASATLTGTTQWAPILNRQLKIGTVVSTSIFALEDAVTGLPIDGTGWSSLSMPTLFVGRIIEFGMPATTSTQLNQACCFQAMLNSQQLFIICQPNVVPMALTLVTGPTPTSWPVFSIAAFPFTMGPYQPLDTAFTGNVSAASGSVTFTSTGAAPNNGVGFETTDVGRSIRINSTPAAFNPATTYSIGNAVLWDNQAYTSLINSNVGQQPDTNPTSWAVTPSLLYWADAEITAVTNSAVVTINLSAYLPFVLPTPNGLTINTFTLGLYTLTGPVWPSCGTFHEGRVWFAGAIPNQIDGSEVQAYTFRPTDINGDVLDTNAIQAQLLSPNANSIYWLMPDQQGIIVGCQTEEWLVTATTLNDPLTPTSFQAHRATKYGSFLAVQPAYAGMALVWPTKNPRDVFEYLADVFSGKFTGLPLNEKAKSVTGFVSLVKYNATPEPIVWGRTFGSSLVGCTYRRVSRFVNEPPRFYAWHTHTFAGMAPFLISMSSTIIPQGATSEFLDSIAVTTSTDPQNSTGNPGTFYHQLLQSEYDPNFPTALTWCLDGAASGLFANLSGFQPNVFVGLSATSDLNAMYFSGLWYQGNSVRVYLGGLDFGDVAVVNGAITVPFASDPQHIGTLAYLQSQCLASDAYSNGACAVQGLGLLPTIIGASYTSTITTLRADTQEQARTPGGPATGLLRRVDQSSCLIGYGLNGAATVSFDGGTAYPMVLRQYINGPALAVNQPFTGVWRDTVENDWSYSGQMTISVSGPTPFQLLSLTPYQETSET